jgi:hypothetical protein
MARLTYFAVAIYDRLNDIHRQFIFEGTTELGCIKSAIWRLTPQDYIEDIREFIMNVKNVQELLDYFAEAYSICWNSIEVIAEHEFTSNYFYND